MKKIILFLLTFLVVFSFINPILNAEQITISDKSKDLPASFSWKNIEGVNYVTDIKDQSPAPTCEAYGFCAILETMMQYQLGEIYNPDLSETHLYFYAGGTYEQGGVNVIDAANYLIEHGVPDEGCYPDPHRAFDYSFESLEGWEDRTVKITNWSWVPHDMESMKTALIEYGPLLLTMPVWKDFYYYRTGVYEHKWGPRVGGHVVTIVGYDDSQACWIVKNSWGKSWGDNGWFKISYEEDFIAEWYGEGTGVMYVEGIYGNFKPDVPYVQIEKPIFSKSYLFGFEFKTIFKKLNLQTAAARIFGPLKVKVTAENAEKVEFYIDGELKETVDEAPFDWKLDTEPGLHTLEARAYKGTNQSIDLVDFYSFF
jgi:hypothetical protein